MLFSVSTYADGIKNSLVVHMKDGSYFEIMLNESPKITFENGVVSFDTKRFLVSEVRKYTFGEYGNSINDVFAQNGVKYDLDGNIIISPNNKKNFAVYTSNGQEIKVKSTSLSNGKILIGFSDLPAGVYIVKYGNESFKIMKK